jgi:hypothetical protein
LSQKNKKNLCQLKRKGLAKNALRKVYIQIYTSIWVFISIFYLYLYIDQILG